MEYPTVMPYLIINNVRRFIDFTKAVFSAEEIAAYNDDNGRIMHAEIKIGTSVIMMGGANDKWPVQNAGLYINVDDADKKYQKALENGASVVTELADQVYGRSGGVKDTEGNTWWITSEIKKS